MLWDRSLVEIDARLYAVASLIARAVWALTALCLVALLPAAEYGQYAFAQILAGLTSQVILGNFGNIVSSRIAALDIHKRPAALLAAIGYGAALTVLAVALGLGTDFFSITSFGSGPVTIAGLWVFAGHIAVMQLGYLLAGKHYGQAATVSALQPIVYLLLISGLPSTSGQTLGLYAAIATGLPSALSMLPLLLKPETADLARGIWQSIIDDHRHSAIMNLASLPGSVALLLVANELAAHDDPTQLAIYGLANQVVGLFFFLPITVGGLAIPQLTRADTLTKRNVVRRLSLTLMLVSAICAVGFLSTAELPFVPQLFEQGKFEIALAFLLAGLSTARSPQVWVNQIERQSRKESASLLINAIFIAAILLLSPITAMLALTFRTAGAAASLVISSILARSTGGPYD